MESQLTAVAAATASASSKKKKMEKEKAATRLVENNTAGSKNQAVSNKKIVPRHVREIQEQLARIKLAEERKQRDEEERIRREEEEHRRQEELECLAQETKRLKKEKEKEKQLKKKMEGKLLTKKQKDEARRLEAHRKQILASSGGLPSSTVDDTGGMLAKRPKYQNKRSKPTSSQPIQETKATVIKKIELEQVVEDYVIDEEEADDNEELDAKTWDDADIRLPGESLSEVDSEPDLGVKMQLKSAQPAAILDADNSKRPDASIVREEARKSDAPPSKSENNLRSPICCVMGHVDSGKTKLLDCIRGTSVQEGEAGHITQQIGATHILAENIRSRTKELKADAKLNVPGLLVIDTPGHEAFTNLRSRGSCLCDSAILVVDIMHGLESQTIESLNLLKMRDTKFVVALNKVDRIYGWKTCRNAPILKAIKQQSKDVQIEFKMRVTQVITQFKEQGINTELYYKNEELMGSQTLSIVPTSAASGEGIPDLLLLLVQWTQKAMVEKLTYQHQVQCTVLDVMVVEGHGTTIDVVLVNGVLHEGDQIVLCGMQGPIVTDIRLLLTPNPMKELRIKRSYLHHKEIKAAQCIKITAQGLEHAIAGTGLYIVRPNDDLECTKKAAMKEITSVMNSIDKSGEGVRVQASSLGSLEALWEFLKSSAVKIPVSSIGIGPVHEEDVKKASVMLEKKKEYATILAFDVKVKPGIWELADKLGVKIFCADVIYHLFDQFKSYIGHLKEEEKKRAAEDAVFPCVLKIIPNSVFNKKDPILLGVEVLKGIAKIGTPLCVPQKDFIDIGRIESIKINDKPVDHAKQGQKVAIKVICTCREEQQKMFGRHFGIEDELISHISRRSIDALKANFRNDLSNDEWNLVRLLKILFKIQ